MSTPRFILTPAELEMIDSAGDALKLLPQRILLELTPVELIGVIGNVQLALQHPANTGETSVLMRSWVQHVIDAVAPAGKLRDFLMLGWRPAPAAEAPE